MPSQTDPGRDKGNRTVELEVTTGGRDNPATIVHEWIPNHRQVLLALDASLGWPVDLGRMIPGSRYPGA